MKRLKSDVKQASLILDIDCVLHQFNLTIKQQIPLLGITGIYGHSGSGKSTLLRIIAGLNKTATGSLILNQQPLFNSLATNTQPFVLSEQRGISMVFQNSRLFPHLSLLDNITFGRKRNKSAKLSLDEIIELTELTALVTTPVNKLSGGEQQRVALARAILAEPTLLLLDEPLSALDQTSKNKLLNLLIKVQNKINLPMLYVSHSLDELQQVADNLLVLSKGKVKHFGNIHQVIQQINVQPGNDFINYQLTSLALPIKKHSTEYSLTTLALPLEQEIHIPSALVSDKALPLMRCFILSNEMSICLTEPKNSSIVNCLSGKITDIIQVQQQVLISVYCDQQTFFVSISRYSLDTLALVVDQAVFIQFKASAVRTFVG